MATRFEEAKVTVPSVLASKGERKLAMLTAYDYTFAQLADAAGADMLLVGDSLAMVVHCLLYTSPSPRDQRGSRMPSSA